MDCSIWPFWPILNPSTSMVCIFHVQQGGKHLSVQLLWIVNSGSIGVTHTSMCSYNRSVATLQAKCRFWLLTALKDNLHVFPERIWNILFVIQNWCLNSYGKYLGTVCPNNPLYWLNYYTWNSSHYHWLMISPSKSSSSSNTSNSDPASSILNEFCEWNGMRTVQTHCDPFDTKKFSNLSLEIFTERPWKHSWTSRRTLKTVETLACRLIPSALLILPNFHLCCYNSIGTQHMSSIS